MLVSSAYDWPKRQKKDSFVPIRGIRDSRPKLTLCPTPATAAATAAKAVADKKKKGRGREGGRSVSRRVGHWGVPFADGRVGVHLLLGCWECGPCSNEQNSGKFY